MRTVVPVAVMLLAFAPLVPAQNAAPDQPKKPAITASPNPVPHGKTAGTTTITWSTGDKSEGTVRVSADGGIEQVFGRGATGSTPAAWIASNSVYEFRLYSAASTTPLASVRVVRAQAPIAATISADPNPVPPGAGFATTTITWSTGDRSEGELFVSANGSPERLFTKGPSGSLKANWIERTGTYDFRLYSASAPRRLLATVRLEASIKVDAPVAPPPAVTAIAPVLAAHPNPVPSGFTAGDTVVSWDAGHLPTGRVLVSVNGGPAQPFGSGPRGAGHAAVVTGSVYEFRLYSGTTLLASIIVMRRDPYFTLFWIALSALLVLSFAYIRRVRRTRIRA